MNLPTKSHRKTPAELEQKEDEKQYLTFTLKGDMFAIGILHIKEILEYGQLTPVPMMPAFIRGVINLRGSVVPVVDLAARFGGTPSKVVKRTCIVILEVETDEGLQDIGVVVDAVSAVIEIADSDIEPAPVFGAKIRADFIQGMGKIDGKFVIILQVNKVLSVDELAMVSQVGGQGDSLETRDE
jgi:purine-binding chemotaxis protein CheW